MTTLQSIGQIVAGSTVATSFQVILPSTLSLTGSYATWEILDTEEGYIWNSGTCNAINSAPSPIDPTQLILSSTASIAFPSNLISNANGTDYQIRYTVILENAAPIYVFDQFQILPPNVIAYGPIDQVELAQTLSLTTNLVLPAAATGVTCVLQSQNSDVPVTCTVGTPIAVQGGWQYPATIPPPSNNPSLLVSVQPYMVVWNYTDSNGNAQTEAGHLFIVNSSMLDIVREVQNSINRAYTDSGISPGTTFNSTDILEYMRQGRDQFNAADKPTQITFNNARGPFRHFWIMYTLANACRAQYLAEGMKSFNYSGQEVQLDVDRTQYWDNMATYYVTQADSQVKQFKDNLYKRGITSGDGSSLALAPNAVGTIGITLSAVSPYRGALWGLQGMGLGMGGLGPFWW